MTLLHCARRSTYALYVHSMPASCQQHRVGHPPLWTVQHISGGWRDVTWACSLRYATTLAIRTTAAYQLQHEAQRDKEQQLRVDTHDGASSTADNRAIRARHEATAKMASQSDIPPVSISLDDQMKRCS